MECLYCASSFFQILIYQKHTKCVNLSSAAYHEIAPHIVLMAFLHRVVNGGGMLEREYAIGSDRMDLCLRYKDVTLGIEFMSAVQRCNVRY